MCRKATTPVTVDKECSKVLKNPKISLHNFAKVNLIIFFLIALLKSKLRKVGNHKRSKLIRTSSSP